MRVFVNEVELRQVLADPESSPNIMPLSTFGMVEISDRHLVKKSIRISVDLAIQPIQVATKFHVIDAYPSYHLLLRGFGFTKTSCCAIHLSSILKGIVKGRMFMSMLRKHLLSMRCTFLKAAFFDGIAKVREATLARPRRISLLGWEEACENTLRNSSNEVPQLILAFSSKEYEESLRRRKAL